MIDLNKQYRTRDGRSVRILCIDRKSIGGDMVVGLVEKENYETLMTWNASGQQRSSYDDLDLVEVSPYEEFKIDDKVLVKYNYEKNWHKRHFAGVDTDGRPLAFIDGKTSWSTDETNHWSQCIKYEE